MAFLRAKTSSTTMQPKLPASTNVVVLATLATIALPLACSSPSPDATGSGGSGPGGSGATATGGLSGDAGGTGGTAGQNGDDRLFVPEGLPNTNVNGVDEGLTLVAFTLSQEATGPALYAAVRNDGESPACQPGMTTEFYDELDQQVSSAGSILQTDRLYRMSDGTIVSCLDPGQVAMAASTDLPDAIVIEDLAYLRHLFPAFILQDIAPIAGLTISDVQTVTTGEGHAYAGKLANGLDVAVRSARVMIFPTNRVGRPLGVATASATTDLPAGDIWSFETNTVGAVGDGYAAFPSASIPQ